MSQLGHRLFYVLLILIWGAGPFGRSLMSLVNSAAGNSVSPWTSATAIWNFARKNDQTLKIQGDVETGIRLNGSEQRASYKRGGDGYVARFRGGYLTTISEKPIQLTGKNASICLRLRDTSYQWGTGLLAKADPQDRLANLIYTDRTHLF